MYFDQIQIASPMHSPAEEEASSEIEQLPDDCLVHILSFLPTLAEKLRASVLSRRWRYLWLYVTCFDFDASTRGSLRLGLRHYRYLSSINSIIQTRATAGAELPLVKHLLIRHYLWKKHKSHIHKWVNFAIENRVETLHLEFGHCNPNQQYKLSEKIWYTAPSGLSSIKCLKSLFLECVNVSKQFVEFILSNCPLLEDLSLDNAGNFTFLDVSGVPPLRLKQLKISSAEDYALDVLSAPNLTSFYYKSGSFLPRMIHVPMLTDLTFGRCDRCKFVNEYLEHFWSYLPQLKRFELIMIKPWNFNFTQMPKLVTLRYLKMAVSWDIDCVITEVIAVIKLCPLLETFALQVNSTSVIDRRPPFFLEQLRRNQSLYRELDNSFVFESLKVLELHGAEGKTINLKVVECIIRKSPNLEKLVVIISNPDATPDPEIVEDVKARAEALCQESHSQASIKIIV